VRRNDVAMPTAAGYQKEKNSTVSCSFATHAKNIGYTNGFYRRCGAGYRHS
jgi:hypothetical protein